MNSGKIEIYQTRDKRTQVEVTFTEDTVWLNRNQLALLFDRDVKTIGKHVNNVFREGELNKNSVVAKFATTAADGKIYQVAHYNLDVTISVGYRIKSQRGTQFRQWATQRLKDYLVQGYAVNKKRLAQKNQEVQYLKTGIRILSRAIEEKADSGVAPDLLTIFAQGLTLLDDYDHEQLDLKGKSRKTALFPTEKEYLGLIAKMKSDFDSPIFGKPKDKTFQSSINQIRQSFNNKELYPSLEEKAAMLLYLIVKNHSFIDGNKRIAAACFLLFLDKNQLLTLESGKRILSNEALAALTLFIAASKSEEMTIIKQLIISILNRNQQ